VRSRLSFLIVLGLLLLPAAAGAEWSDPHRLSSDPSVGNPLLAFDGSGNAIATWPTVRNGIVPTGYRYAYHARREVPFDPQQRVPFPLDQDRHHFALFGTRSFAQLEVARRCDNCNPPGATLRVRLGGFLPPNSEKTVVLRRTGRIDSQAIDAAPRGGSAVVAWSEIGTRSRVHQAYVVLRSGRRLSRPRRIAPPGAVDVAVAADPGGSGAIVAWTRKARIEARILRGGRWGRVQHLGTGTPRGLEATMDPVGEAAVAWRTIDPRCADEGCDDGQGNPTRISLATSTSRGHFRPEVVLDSYEDLGGSGTAGPLRLEESATGPVVAWSGTDAVRRYRVRVARLTPAGEPQVETVSPAGESATLSPVDASSNAIFVSERR
jgi:hypothetical protein